MGAKISRREFCKRALLIGGALFIAPPMLFSRNNIDIGQLRYVPISDDNPSIEYIKQNCGECSDCVKACSSKATVLGSFSKANKPVCIHCGACARACERDAMVVKSSISAVNKALKNHSKIVVFSTSPSVRVALGDMFAMTAGADVESQMVGAIRRLGAERVFDVAFGADLTVMEEAHELVERIKNSQNLPQFTSCCPAWVSFAEIFFPHLLPNLSTTRSPISMLGSIIKSYYAESEKLNARNIVHVAVTPCSAKKAEILRSELSVNGLRATDYVLTTVELAQMIRTAEIDFAACDSKYDQLLGNSSASGLVFGNSSGVMIAALRTAHYLLTGSNPTSENFLQFTPVDGIVGAREATVNIGEKQLRVAVVQGTKSARAIIERRSDYHFIEVMSCDGGCIGGAGQPRSSIERIKHRIQGLNSKAATRAVNYSHENTDVKLIYDKYIDAPLSYKAKKLLHTSYQSKAWMIE